MPKAFTQAVQGIVPRIRTALLAVPSRIQAQVTEIRLRSNAPVLLYTLSGALYLLPDGRTDLLWRSDVLQASWQNVQDTFLAMCGYSVHSVQREICEGYLFLPGGHRAGLCGQAVTDDMGRVQSLASVTSICLRIARHRSDGAQVLWDSLFREGLRSVILAGPPNSGKTTVLRDLARRLSENLYRVSVLDSRRELSPLPMCDVYAGYDKAQGILCALRSMAPQIILCDEVASVQEVEALEQGFAAGVFCVSTVHAQDEGDLYRRKPLRCLLNTGQFSHVVLLASSAPCQIQRIYTKEELGVCDGSLP